MAGTFLKHESGDVVLVHTTAAMQHYQNNGYAVCTWDEWYSAQGAESMNNEPIDTVIIDRDTAQNAAAGIEQLLDMLADQGTTHAPVIEKTLAALRGYLEAQE